MLCIQVLIIASCICLVSSGRFLNFFYALSSLKDISDLAAEEDNAVTAERYYPIIVDFCGKETIRIGRNGFKSDIFFKYVDMFCNNPGPNWALYVKHFKDPVTEYNFYQIVKPIYYAGKSTRVAYMPKSKELDFGNNFVAKAVYDIVILTNKITNYKILNDIKTYDEVEQLKKFYNKTYVPINHEVVDYNHSAIYENHDFTTIELVEALIHSAMNETYDDWAGEYKDFHDCAYKKVKYENINDYINSAMIFFCFAFLLLLFFRRILMQLMVKKEYTASGWKKESFKNKLNLGLLAFVSLLFLTYLFWVPDYRATYLNGILGRYWIA